MRAADEKRFFSSPSHHVTGTLSQVICAIFQTQDVEENLVLIRNEISMQNWLQKHDPLEE